MSGLPHSESAPASRSPLITGPHPNYNPGSCRDVPLGTTHREEIDPLRASCPRSYAVGTREPLVTRTVQAPLVARVVDGVRYGHSTFLSTTRTTLSPSLKDFGRFDPTSFVTSSFSSSPRATVSVFPSTS